MEEILRSLQESFIGCKKRLNVFSCKDLRPIREIELSQKFLLLRAIALISGLKNWQPMDKDGSFVRQLYGRCCCDRKLNAYAIQISADI
jgi:hypothetical protein